MFSEHIHASLDESWERECKDQEIGKAKREGEGEEERGPHQAEAERKREKCRRGDRGDRRND